MLTCSSWCILVLFLFACCSLIFCLDRLRTRKASHNHTSAVPSYESKPPDPPLLTLLTPSCRNLSNSPPQVVGCGGLEIKVCVRTYRLFFVSGTEGLLFHPRTDEELLRARARVANRRGGREVLEALVVDP